MTTKLKLRIENAIDKVLEDASENSEDLWEWYPHSTIAKQMANAAECVFDSCQDGQKFYSEDIIGE